MYTMIINVTILFITVLVSIPARADVDFKTVTFIECKNAKGETIGQGSGVVISSRGHVLTVAHLFRGHDPQTLECSAMRGTAASGSGLPMIFRQRIANADAAILQIKNTTQLYSFLRYCAVTDAHLLQPVLALGYPGASTSGQISVRAGVLSTTFTNPMRLLETDALTARGMSGGAVVLSGTNGLLGVIVGADLDAGTSLPVHYGILPISEIAHQVPAVEKALDADCAPSQHIRMLEAELKELRVFHNDVMSLWPKIRAKAAEW